MIVAFFIAFFSFFLFSCSEKDSVAGGSDHPNEITGTVYAETGPYAGAHVKLYRSQLSSLSDQEEFLDITDTLLSVTDSNGKFHFSQLESGKYQIESISKDSTKVGLSKQFLLQDTLFTAGRDLEIKNARKLVGFVRPDSIQGKSKELSLKGTPYKATINEKGEFSFPLIPEGEFEIWFTEERTLLETFNTEHFQKDTLIIYPPNPKDTLRGYKTHVLGMTSDNQIIHVLPFDTIIVELSSKFGSGYLWQADPQSNFQMPWKELKLENTENSQAYFWQNFKAIVPRFAGETIVPQFIQTQVWKGGETKDNFSFTLKVQEETQKN